LSVSWVGATTSLAFVNESICWAVQMPLW
jgi:hypothetical protein